METILSIYEKQLQKNAGGRKLLTVVDSRLESTSCDLLTLDKRSSRAAACLKAYGCEKGDRVLISSRSTVQIWSFFWAALKLGAVPCVLFPELGAGGLQVRLNAAEANFLITDADPAKIAGAVVFPESLKKIILTVTPKTAAGQEFAVYDESQETAAPEFSPVQLDAEDPAFMVFTSGTTGTPKPVVHRHGIAEAVVRSMKNILHASPEDIYWCTAHPAWITGTVYGILGPVLCGIPSIQYEGKFHAKRWMPILQDQKVSLWYTAPTALRGLMREQDPFFEGFDFSALKQVYSIGEPLSAGVYGWGSRIFHQPVYDTWFQTECGTIRIANQPGQPIKPGWMGRAVDDSEVMIPDPDETGRGKLCLKAGFSSMFTGYYRMPEAAEQKVRDGVYDTGDLAVSDADGCLRFEGRADDVINTSGHLVGPLEVENVLCTHPAVTAAAVVGEPDELLYEAPAAFLVLAEGTEWNRQLETSLKMAVNSGVSPYAVPKHFYLVSDLPQTPGGKINRAELRKEFQSRN